MTISSVQANEVTYELHTLGWKAFQHLCVTVMSEMWGQTVQGFFEGNDGGRDGAFHGRWTPRGSEILEGSFVAQCKFSAAPNRVVALADLSDELDKTQRLGTQPVVFKSEIKPLLPSVAANDHFSPELARRLGHPAFTKGLWLSEPGLAHFVEHPLGLLKEVIRTLDAASRAGIALVFRRHPAAPMSARPGRIDSVRRKRSVRCGCVVRPRAGEGQLRNRCGFC